MAKLKYVNLGCGSRCHPDWINIDIAPTRNEVIAHDLSRGIPLADASCDVVYHSHLLEHLRPPQALQFMRDCLRVLRPGGVLRVAIPDLEQICIQYLNQLQKAGNGDQDAASDYDWMLLEMYDQTVREQSGGLMLDYLSRSSLPNETFIYERIGEEGRELVRAVREKPASDSNSSRAHREPRSLRTSLRRLLNFPRIARSRLLTRWLGPDGARALEIGRFRLAGEVHQWMYDRFSLARLMLTAGFQNPVVQRAAESQIPEWASFNLDTLADGTVVKPDSLFMEAQRPL